MTGTAGSARHTRLGRLAGDAVLLAPLPAVGSVSAPSPTTSVPTPPRPPAPRPPEPEAGSGVVVRAQPSPGFVGGRVVVTYSGTNVPPDEVGRR
ncbi:hypothetical protein ACF08M_08015 [Streptomyces sp. NPDC015032]|uniref:hypothetical protein n=1 Tax=Streptomyces sp. NPDC015032 TaxID=3364937 RepID=UPI003700EA04